MGSIISRIITGFLSMFGIGRLTDVPDEDVTHISAPFNNINESEVRKRSISQKPEENELDSGQENFHSESRNITDDIVANTRKESLKSEEAVCQFSNQELVNKSQNIIYDAEKSGIQVLSTPETSVSEKQDAEIEENNIKDTHKSKKICWFGSASSVFVSGNWLNWRDTIALHPDSSLLNWEVEVDFPSHLDVIELKFIIDDEWMTSDDMPLITNDVGSRNNVIYL